MATTAALVQRPRLFAMLDRGAEGRVTVVSAPAGSGKTTLLSLWLREARLPGAPAWVAVERDESDATRFWGTVMDSLRDSGAIAPGTRSRRYAGSRSRSRRTPSLVQPTGSSERTRPTTPGRPTCMRPSSKSRWTT